METLAEVFRYLNILLLASLAAMSFRRSARQPHAPGRWLALTFTALAAVFAIRVISKVLPDTYGDIALKVTVTLAVLFPYLLFRFTASLRRPSRALEWIVLAPTALILAWTVLIPAIPFADDPRPEWFRTYLLAIVVQWVALSGVVAIRLWRAGRGQPTVARYRMRLLSFGSVLLSIAVVMAGAGPGERPPLLDLGFRLTIFISALLFFGAFSPPRFLRVAWRRREEDELRRATLTLMTASTPDEVSQTVLPRMASIVGARAVALIDQGGAMLGSWRVAPEMVLDVSRPAPADEVRTQRSDMEMVNVRFPQGSLIVWTSPYAPFFGDEEFEILRSLAVLTKVALDRSRLFAQEREARVALERADEVKNAFLSAVSHELRTPLTGILGIAYLLERKGGEIPQEQSKVMLQDLLSQAEKLHRLLSDLLDLDRLSRGIVTPQLRSTGAAELVRRTLEEVDLEGRNVGIDVEDVVVTVDPAKVERIVENLLSNAARHTPQGARLWLSVRGDQGGVLIAVEDEGPGIPDDQKASIFEPFRTGATRSTVRGTGIGLSLVSRFAELHGGRAWVEDRPGGGASFRVFLPAPSDRSHGTGGSSPPRQQPEPLEPGVER